MPAAEANPAFRRGGVSRWDPESGRSPVIDIYVEPFKANDLGMDTGWLGEFWPFGSVVQTFAGDDEELRRAFQREFEPYLRGRAKGDSLHPEVSRGAGAAVIGAGAESRLLLLGDNLYNPYRWIGPINEVHHHEQHALCAVLPSEQSQIAETSNVLAAFRRGDTMRRIVLEYDLEVEVADRRGEMAEWSVQDLYGDSGIDGSGLMATTHRIAVRTSRGEPVRGRTLSAVARKNVDAYLKTRFVQANLQIGLMVNFKEESPAYRLAEFMVASKNQQTMTRPPSADDPVGGMATANALYNTHVVDGGNSGHVAWHRVPVSLLKNPRFIEQDPDLAPLIHGGDHVEIPDGGIPAQRFTGSIDITNYYAMGLRHGFFPGLRGYWGTDWVGFAGDVEQFRDTDETRAIHWIGVLFENHGPFRVSADVRRLRASIISRSAGYHAPGRAYRIRRTSCW